VLEIPRDLHELADAAGITGEIAHRACEAVGGSVADVRKALAFVRQQEAENPLAELLRLRVPGDPGAARRPRKARFKTADGWGERFHPGDADEKLNLVQLFRLQVPHDYVPVEGACQVTLEVYKAPPKSMPPFKLILAEAGYLMPETAPDFDNYLKIVSDALNKLAWRDDGQVSQGGCFKFFSLRPRAELVVWGRRRRMHK